MKPEDLPGVLADMAEIAGVGKALEYAARFGGPAVYLPRVFDPEHPECWGLALVFGEDAARRICERIGGGEVSLPVTRRQRLQWAAKRMTTKEAARFANVSQRAVLRMRRALKGGDDGEERNT